MIPPIVRIAIAYGAGLWVGLVVLVPSRAIVALAAGAAVSIALRRRGVAAGFLLLGMAAGDVAGLREAGACAHRWRPGSHAALLELHDRPSRRGITSGTVLHASEGCTGTLRLRFDSAEVPAGTRLLAVGTFRAPEVLRVRRFRLLSGAPSWRFKAREALDARVNRLYGDRAPLVEALILGRREDLAPALRSQFAAAGLAHLLAISGLHVGILAGWWTLVLGGVVGQKRALLAGTLGAWAYVALLGMPAPATRAAAFLTVRAVSRWRQRHPPPGVVLAVAVLVVLAADPSAVTAAGAWLSAAAVWGSGAASRAVPAQRGRSRAWQLLASSAGATVATAPITAWVFGAVAPIGMVANLVAIPLAGLAVPAVFMSLWLGGWMAPGAGLALAATEQTAALAAGVPGGRLEGEPGPAFALPWIALLAVLLWTRRRRPSWVVARRRLLMAATAGTWLGVVLPTLRAPGHPATMEIDVLDVGQGDAIAVRTPRGRWLLIDGGPRTPVGDAGRAVVLPFFRHRGVRRLDVVIASHADADHLGGLPTVVRELEPSLVLEPGQPVGTPLYLEYLAAVDALGVDWRAARAGDTLLIDSLTVAVIHPAARWLATHTETNENSVMVRLSYGGFDALFTGDAGWPAESALAPAMTETEFLKVGHHGSAGGTSDPWLDALRPRVAAISVGENRFGHPAPGVLARLARHGVVVRRTDRGGTVTVESDGRYFWVRQGGPTTLAERLRCLRASWLPSSDSSSIRSACTAARPESFPTSSTTSPWPRK